MANNSANARPKCGHEEAQAISGATTSSLSGDEEVKRLREIVRSLPTEAVKELFSKGVCPRCILRLLGVEGCVFTSLSLSTSILCSLIEQMTSLDSSVLDGCCEQNGGFTSPLISRESPAERQICRTCLGIMQFTYYDDKRIMVKKESANELAASIAELVRREGHQIDCFGLEVSMPPVIVENDELIWCYIRSKYDSELWFQERMLFGRLSIKDAFKFCITDSLEKLLGIKSGPGSLRFRLTYTDTIGSMKVQNTVDTIPNCKRRRTCFGYTVDSRHGATGITACSPSSEILSAAEVRNHEILPKVNEPCSLTYHCFRTPIYVGGRYLKYSRNVSQTRWVIDDERMGEASVEEIIGGSIVSACHGDNYKFQAAGREDIDVRMLGSGRPFLLEIQNARLLPSDLAIKDMERKIDLENEIVKVKCLRVVGSEGRSMMQEGEAEKQKQYAALVWISRPLKDEDFHTISALKDLEILQNTPVRVLHRRSPLERGKTIHWMKIERITGSSQYFLLHLCTQAGTYIKEFVHGDLGRSHPSIGSILGCRAEILQLDVTDVKMDCFL